MVDGIMWCMFMVDGIMFMFMWCMFDGVIIDSWWKVDGMFQVDGKLGKLRIRISEDSPPKPVDECSNGIIDIGIDHDDHQAGKFEYIDVDGIMLNSDGWNEPAVWWPKAPNGIMFMFIIDSIVRRVVEE